MLDDKSWTVDIRLTYTVQAHSPDQALGAVLPLVSLGRDRYGPQPEIADYTVRERAGRADPARVDGPLRPGLEKSVYTAKEVAALLNISTASVYETIPCMRIGGSRRYSRAVILEILEHGKVPEPPPLPAPVYHERKRPEERAKVTSKASPAPKPFLTIKEVAKTLRISPYRVRQLLEAKKIHYFTTHGGGMQIRRDAVEHYVNGGTPREFVEQVIADGEKAAHFKDDPDSLAKIAAEWREAWPE